MSYMEFSTIRGKCFDASVFKQHSKHQATRNQLIWIQTMTLITQVLSLEALGFYTLDMFQIWSTKILSKIFAFEKTHS